MSFGTDATITGAVFSINVGMHAALFTARVMLFLMHSSLVATHRVAVHRRLGAAVAALAAVTIGSERQPTLSRAAELPGQELTAGIPPRPPGRIWSCLHAWWSAVLGLRRNSEAHKHLILLAYAVFLVSAVARFSGVLPLDPLWFFGLTLLRLGARDDLRPGDAAARRNTVRTCSALLRKTALDHLLARDCVHRDSEKVLRRELYGDLERLGADDSGRTSRSMLLALMSFRSNGY